MYEAKVRINNHCFDFVRLHQELEGVTSPQMEKGLYREVPQFGLLENPSDFPHYAKELVSSFGFLASHLEKEYSLLNERYSDLFETMNTRSNFVLNESNAKYGRSVSRLTWALVFLGVVMTAAVIVQIVVMSINTPT